MGNFEGPGGHSVLKLAVLWWFGASRLGFQGFTLKEGFLEPSELLESL